MQGNCRALGSPRRVDADKLKANISQGVLKGVVSKPAAKQAKKIDVKAAASGQPVVEHISSGRCRSGLFALKDGHAL
jgi:hypothetical protein